MDEKLEQYYKNSIESLKQKRDIELNKFNNMLKKNSDKLKIENQFTYE